MTEISHLGWIVEITDQLKNFTNDLLAFNSVLLTRQSGKNNKINV